jgi:XTP/dITP diphosphohydrolase
MRRQILLATRNKNKAGELETLLAGFKLRVLGLDEFPELKEIEETGSTFTENALLKARYACSATGLVALADDSGLEVDALNGEPGIYSARFYLKNPARNAAAQNPPEQKTTDKDAANIACLLERMKNIPEGQRQARFCCAIAAAAPAGGFITAFGAWPGVIAHEPVGKCGFGYDPVFWDPKLKRTAGQIAPAVKNSRSHRYLALQNLLRLWPDFWAGVSG